MSLVFLCSKEKTQVSITPKPAIRWLWCIQIIKEMISNPKQPSCKKGAAPKTAMVKKRCEIQGGSQEMVVMVD